MLKPLRQHIVHTLWKQYRHATPQINLIEKGLKKRGIQKIFLDHFAIIDLPGPYTGISHLSQIFSYMGYTEQGKDYLPEKQNDFLWMAESDSLHISAHDALPQVVVADFRMDDIPLEIKKIVEKYASKASPSPINQIQKRVTHHNTQEQLCALIVRYLSGRDWPLPTTNEFYTIQEFNELLAWVLVFGRRPNHFTLSIHLLNHFSQLTDFHRFIEEEIKLNLNREGGIIKGGRNVGIAQGSTIGTPQSIKLSDGNIKIPTGFVEFVWRYPHKTSCKTPTLWKDFFTGFIAQHADRIIESLYD